MITKPDLMCDDSSRQDNSVPVTLSHDAYMQAKGKTEQACEKKESSEVLEEPVADGPTDNHTEGDDDKNMSIEELLTKANTYSSNSYDEETIEVSYSVFGYDEIDEMTIDVNVKEREYDFLMNQEEEGEYLDSEFISEHRRGLHKRILRAIRENMEDEEVIDNPDLIDDDDIEYTITVY